MEALFSKMEHATCVMLVLLAIGLSTVRGSPCTNPEIPENCSCETHPWSGPEVKMICERLRDPGQLLRALRLNANVVELHLVNCNLPYLPLGLAPHSLIELHITNSTLTHISPPLSSRSAFDGLTNLTTLIIKGVSDLSNWNWEKLKPLSALQSIHIEDSRLPVLPSSFSTLGDKHYWTLNVTNSQLLQISPSALSSKTLRTFATRGNPLVTLRINMHSSNKALQNLEIIGTRALSTDKFLDGLSNLRSLVTDAHFLTYIPSGELRYKKMDHFEIVGEPPNCECRYSYLLDHGLRWLERCTLSTSTLKTDYIFTEFLKIVC